MVRVYSWFIRFNSFVYIFDNVYFNSMKYCEKCEKEVIGRHEHCPECDSAPREHELRNYDLIWGDGEIWCLKCEIKVRNFDRG